MAIQMLIVDDWRALRTWAAGHRRLLDPEKFNEGGLRWKRYWNLVKNADTKWIGIYGDGDLKGDEVVLHRVWFIGAHAERAGQKPRGALLYGLGHYLAYKHRHRMSNSRLGKWKEARKARAEIAAVRDALGPAQAPDFDDLDTDEE